uniref:Uncharacterized protein n=1 Tax=Romanomermis culicivorax TaxID=13658 RepID=A0A915HP60_ROMCU
MAGALSRANLKTSLIILAPSPAYICTTSAPPSRTNVHFVWAATIRANMVFPVPGSPYIKTPLGGLMFNFRKSSGLVIGNMMASVISRIGFDKPPISSTIISLGFKSLMSTNPTTGKKIVLRRDVFMTTPVFFRESSCTLPAPSDSSRGSRKISTTLETRYGIFWRGLNFDRLGSSVVIDDFTLAVAADFVSLVLDE